MPLNLLEKYHVIATSGRIRVWHYLAAKPPIKPFQFWVIQPDTQLPNQEPDGAFDTFEEMVEAAYAVIDPFNQDLPPLLPIQTAEELIRKNAEKIMARGLVPQGLLNRVSSTIDPGDLLRPQYETDSVTPGMVREAAAVMAAGNSSQDQNARELPTLEEPVRFPLLLGAVFPNSCRLAPVRNSFVGFVQTVMPPVENGFARDSPVAIDIEQVVGTVDEHVALFRQRLERVYDDAFHGEGAWLGRPNHIKRQKNFPVHGPVIVEPLSRIQPPLPDTSVEAYQNGLPYQLKLTPVDLSSSGTVAEGSESPGATGGEANVTLRVREDDHK